MKKNKIGGYANKYKLLLNKAIKGLKEKNIINTKSITGYNGNPNLSYIEIYFNNGCILTLIIDAQNMED